MRRTGESDRNWDRETPWHFGTAYDVVANALFVDVAPAHVNFPRLSRSTLATSFFVYNPPGRSLLRDELMDTCSGSCTSGESLFQGPDAMRLLATSI